MVRIDLVSRIWNYIMNYNIFDIDWKILLQRFNFSYFWSKLISDAWDILRFPNGKSLLTFLVIFSKQQSTEKCGAFWPACSALVDQLAGLGLRVESTVMYVSANVAIFQRRTNARQQSYHHSNFCQLLHSTCHIVCKLCFSIFFWITRL